mmetsp:Transcript_12949/g.39141  ORF Transcript_12949/g.39141 Transcript_12949/m.39141 type:complete len:362 (-) Transcript_12949:3935-5020(-)
MLVELVVEQGERVTADLRVRVREQAPDRLHEALETHERVHALQHLVGSVEHRLLGGGAALRIRLLLSGRARLQLGHALLHVYQHLLEERQVRTLHALLVLALQRHQLAHHRRGGQILGHGLPGALLQLPSRPGSSPAEPLHQSVGSARSVRGATVYTRQQLRHAHKAAHHRHGRELFAQLEAEGTRVKGVGRGASCRARCRPIGVGRLGVRVYVAVVAVVVLVPIVGGVHIVVGHDRLLTLPQCASPQREQHLGQVLHSERAHQHQEDEQTAVAGHERHPVHEETHQRAHVCGAAQQWRHHGSDQALEHVEGVIIVDAVHGVRAQEGEERHGVVEHPLRVVLGHGGQQQQHLVVRLRIAAL